MFKRRKIADDKENEKLPISDTRSVGVAITGTAYSISTTTTIQNNGSFAHPTEVGFISAATQLQQHQQEWKENQPAKGMSKRKNGNLISAQVKRTPLATPGDQSKASSGRDSKGTLLRFFSKNQSCRRPQDSTVKSATIASLDITRNGGGHLGGHGDLELLEKGITSKAQVSVSDETQCAPSRRPLAGIPSALGHHKLQATTNLSRPHLSSKENDYCSKQYVFLSSSPPPLEDVGETAEVKNDNQLHSRSITGKVQPNSQMQNNNYHIRPAATFHNTSVAQVQAAPNLQKKTLGVRRSMTGWANRANKGFSVPSKTNDNA